VVVIRALLLFVALAILNVPRFVAAQHDRGDSSTEEARHLFEQGTEALTSRRYADAEQLLMQSIAIHAHPATAYNLGVAQLRQGRSHDAVATLERLLADHYGPINTQQLQEATELLASTRSSLSTLLVEIEYDRPALLRVDNERGRMVDGDGVVRILVDGGTHRLALYDRGDSERLAYAEVTVEPGAALSVRLDSHRIRGAHAPQGADMSEPHVRSQAMDDSSASTWLWVAIAAGAAVIAAIGVGAWFLWGPDTGPFEDPVFGNVEAMSAW
jgi:hypothetical protein